MGNVNSFNNLNDFLRKDESQKIDTLILSNVPVYNRDSHVLSFERDTKDLPDNVLKIYFNVENESKIDLLKNARKQKQYQQTAESIIKDVLKRAVSHDGDKTINVQIEGSSYGVDPVAKGLLNVKCSELGKLLSLKNGQINISMIPRSILNGVKPEHTAMLVDELFTKALKDGYGSKTKDTVAFVNIDVLSDDTLGRFEYHDIGSTDSFLSELDKLQQKHPLDKLWNQQRLLVAVNDECEEPISKDIGLIQKSIQLVTGTAKKDFFADISDSGKYKNIAVKKMKDIVNDIANMSKSNEVSASNYDVKK